jgi:hypothetical protein
MIQEMRFTFKTDELMTVLATHLKIEARVIKGVEIVRAGEKNAPVFGGLILTVAVEQKR